LLNQSIDIQAFIAYLISYIYIIMPPRKNFSSSIKYLLGKNRFLTHRQIAEMVKMDKAKASGYLQAMVDFGEICMQKVGNSKAYYLKPKGKK